MSDDMIGLGDAVQAVRDELMNAAAAGAGQDVVFEVGDIQMEFTVELRRETQGSAGVRAWVVDAGANRLDASSRTHRITCTLRPVDARTGGSWKVGDEIGGAPDPFGRRADAS